MTCPEPLPGPPSAVIGMAASVLYTMLMLMVVLPAFTPKKGAKKKQPPLFGGFRDYLDTACRSGWSWGFWLMYEVFCLGTLVFGHNCMTQCVHEGGSLLNENPVTIFDLSFGFSPREAFDMIKNYGEKGRVWYLWLALWDYCPYMLGYIMLTSMLGAWAASKTLRPGSTLWFFLPLIGVGGWLLDCIENFCYMTMVSRYPEEDHSLALVLRACTLGKWLSCVVLLGGSVAVFFVGKKPAVKEPSKRQTR